MHPIQLHNLVGLTRSASEYFWLKIGGELSSLLNQTGPGRGVGSVPTVVNQMKYFSSRCFLARWPNFVVKSIM
jgi:hypothetical protein